MNIIETAAPPRQSVGRGILWMLFSMLIFMSMDAISKYLAQTYPVFEVVWIRYIFHLMAMLPFMGRRLPRIVVTRAIHLQGLRAGASLISTLVMILAFRYIPLAEATAVAAASPLIVTALSAVVLKEVIGVRRWTSVVIGFVGVLIIIRPGLGIVHPAAALPLVVATFYAVNQVATRRLGAIDAPLTTVFYTAVFGLVATTAAMPFVWVTPSPFDWGFMIAVGALSFMGHFAQAQAFQAAPASTVTPFNYSALLWATLWGFLFFGDLPDQWTVLGAAVIVGSGLYIFRRARKREAGEPEPAA